MKARSGNEFKDYQVTYLVTLPATNAEHYIELLFTSTIKVVNLIFVGRCGEILNMSVLTILCVDLVRCVLEPQISLREEVIICGGVK